MWFDQNATMFESCLSVNMNMPRTYLLFALDFERFSKFLWCGEKLSDILFTPPSLFLFSLAIPIHIAPIALFSIIDLARNNMRNKCNYFGIKFIQLIRTSRIIVQYFCVLNGFYCLFAFSSLWATLYTLINTKPFPRSIESHRNVIYGNDFRSMLAFSFPFPTFIWTTFVPFKQSLVELHCNYVTVFGCAVVVHANYNKDAFILRASSIEEHERAMMSSS